MAKKPLLDATTKPKSVYSAFTEGYRQSANIEDRRAEQFRPSSTNNRGGALGGGTGYVKDAYTTSTADQAGDESAIYGGKVGSDPTPGKAYKASPDEAIRKTHLERK